MTQIINTNSPTWQHNSGHYAEFYDEEYNSYQPSSPKRNYDDLSFDYQNEFDLDPMGIGMDSFSYENKSGIELSPVVNNHAPAPMQYEQPTQSYVDNSQYAQSINASYAWQIASVASVIAQNYYGIPYYQRRVVQDSEISPVVYSMLEVKPDNPFENVKREVEENNDEIVRPKKRMRKTVDLPDPKSFRNFSEYKEALNSMDSISFENYIQDVKEHYQFTPAEKSEVKSIRGRIKNREAARKSRMKKKNQPMVLEDTVRELLIETRNMEKKIADLQQERIELYKETSYLSNTISALLGNKEFSELYKEFYEKINSVNNGKV
jgi:hypothetical protein